MKHFQTWVRAGLAAVFTGLLSTSTAAAERLVLKGATVIDVVAGRAIEQAVVVIDGDRIRAVGGPRTAIPADVKVVDLRGKYIIPGLVDSHAHYRPFTGELYLNHGVTAVLTHSGVGAAGADQAYWNASARGEVRVPRLFGLGRAQLPRRPNMSREEVRAAVAQYVRGEPDFAFLEDYNLRNAQVWAWKVEDLHAAGIAVFGHSADAAKSMALGHDGLEHMWGLAQSLMTPEEYENYRRGKYLHWGSFLDDEAGVDRLVAEGVRNKVYLNPTLNYNLGSLSPRAAQYEALMSSLYKDGALMSYYPQNLADGLLLRMRSVWVASGKYGTYVRLSQLAPADRAELERSHRLINRLVVKWVQAGGKIAGGTDDPFIGTPGLSAHLEMAMLVDAGLTPMQALQAMTIWGAEILTARRLTPTTPPVGHLDGGAFADLVVLGADPLKNIDNTRRIERVMKGGRFLTLGYTPAYPPTPPEDIKAVPATPEPEITAVTPNTFVEGGEGVEVVVEGNGFTFESVVRVDDVALPTTFVSIRRLKAKLPASVLAAGQRNRFRTFGLDQYAGVYGDHTAKVTVFNHPPDGGVSNSVFLRVQEPWVAEATR